MWRRYLSPPSDPIRTVARSSATVAHFCVVWRAGHRRVCPDFKVGESKLSSHCSETEGKGIRDQDKGQREQTLIAVRQDSGRDEEQRGAAGA